MSDFILMAHMLKVQKAADKATTPRDLDYTFAALDCLEYLGKKIDEEQEQSRCPLCNSQA